MERAEGIYDDLDGGLRRFERLANGVVLDRNDARSMRWPDDSRSSCRAW